MLIREEIYLALQDPAKREKIFDGLSFSEKTHKDLVSSLLAGHHILILGPPGSGKTRLANNISCVLPEIEVVQDCPMNCRWEDPKCPWCQGENGQKVKARLGDRLVRIQGHPDLKPEDIVGDLDPEYSLQFGMRDLRSFSPGKLLKGNNGILLIDLIDQIPERTLNLILQVLDGDMLQLGKIDKRLPMDLLIVGTGTEKSLRRLSTDLLDHFDVTKVSYPSDPQEDQRILRENLKGLDEKEETTRGYVDKMVELVHQIDRHDDVAQGISPRGSVHCAQLFETLPFIHERPDMTAEDFYEAAMLSFPHRLKLKQSALSSVDPNKLVSELILGKDEVGFDEMAMREFYDLEDISDIAKELAEKDLFRIPLRYGFNDILLQRIKNAPDSELARLHAKVVEEIRKRKEESLGEKRKKLAHDMELLQEIEDARVRMEDPDDYLLKALDEQALEETLEVLHKLQVLQRDREGWVLHKRGVRRLMDNLLPPEFGQRARITSDGKHRTSIRTAVLFKERSLNVRKYRLGDRYKDFALRETIREALKKKRNHIEREDFRVYDHGRTTRLDIILALDVSGTMVQGDKLWYAKEAAGALASASAIYRDRVGLVTFSNMAKKLLDPTDNPLLVMETMVNLSIHKKAFTNIGQAFKVARQLILTQKKSTTTPHVILISDGDATAPYTDPDGYAVKEAVITRSKGITISTVCLVEGSSNVDLMRKLSKIGGGRIFLVENIQALPDIMLQEQKATVAQR